MESTGIIRRVDDLGRIVLPKEIRRKVARMNIKQTTNKLQKALIQHGYI